MAWVMSSRRDGPDITFCIGSVRVAVVHMYKASDGWHASLIQGGGVTNHRNVSDAMKAMHRNLNSLPPEGFTVGGNRHTKL